MSKKKELIEKEIESEEAEEEIEEEDEEEMETEEEAEETEESEDTEDDEEEQLEKVADKLAARVKEKVITTKFDLKEIQAKVDRAIGRSMGNDMAQGYSLASKIYGPEGVKSGVETLTGEEKIIGFWQALLHKDHIALKALSEGVQADGGYLFPDEFKAVLIKELAAPNRMRSLVTVVPMKRDVMKIPKEGSQVQVRWTSENAAKSTTTASFEQKTLTVYKMTAIIYALVILAPITKFMEKAVNSVNILFKRTIPSQAGLVMA